MPVFVLPNEKAGFEAVGAAVARGVVDEVAPKENGFGWAGDGAPAVVVVEDSEDGAAAAVVAAVFPPPKENGVEDVVFPPKRDVPGAFCCVPFEDVAAVEDAPEPPNNDVEGVAELFSENEEGAALPVVEPKENGLDAVLLAPIVDAGLAPKPKLDDGVAAAALEFGVPPKLNPPVEAPVAVFELFAAEPKPKDGVLLVLSLFEFPKREFELEPDPKEKALLLPAVK